MNRINLICLGVRDIKKSLAFYKNIGFKTYEKADQPVVVFFDNQGSKLELYPLEELARDIDAENPPPLSQGGFGGITLACNVKSREEVDAFMKMVQQHGGVIAKQPRDVFWGGYSGYFRDPDGYYWEVAYGPDWEFDAHGMLRIEDAD
ncbi:VOC family protein [Desulfovibrio sp.]|uniref:VOC family protein n=1 Tax=Desulfovibrio sp. TaxID=885 RepID=UPI0025BAA7A0|nr:VOC family protein [Desulfovibrio sp.]